MASCFMFCFFLNFFPFHSSMLSFCLSVSLWPVTLLEWMLHPPLHLPVTSILPYPLSFPFLHPQKRRVVFPETQVQSYQRGAGPRSQRHDFNVIHALRLLMPLPAHLPFPIYSPPSPNHTISLTDCVILFL